MEKDQEPNQEEQDFFNLLNNIHEKNYGENQAASLGEILYYTQKEYTNSKGKIKKKKDESSAPVLYVKLIYSEKTKKILSIFNTKGKKISIHLIILINTLIQKRQ